MHACIVFEHVLTSSFPFPTPISQARVIFLFVYGPYTLLMLKFLLLRPMSYCMNFNDDIYFSVPSFIYITCYRSCKVHRSLRNASITTFCSSIGLGLHFQKSKKCIQRQCNFIRPISSFIFKSKSRLC